MRKPHNVILIIDDTPDNLRVLGELLEASKFDVRVANNGAHGLEIAQSSVVDLVLLDIMMPGLDGYEVCRRLKKDKQTRDIPVIFLTALDSSDDEAKGLKLGAVDYISKPFKLDLVRSRVMNHLALHNARQELRRHNEKLEELVAERSAELAEAHRRLLTIDSAQYDFLQVIYQELWAPESGIIDLSRKALGMLDLSRPDQADLAQRYETSQANLFETINNALLMAGIHQGDAAPDLHPVVLGKVLDGALEKLKPLACQKKLSFGLQLGEPGIVAGDLDLLFQAMTTVLHVAILLARTATTISLVSVDHEGRIVLRVKVIPDKMEPGETAGLFDTNPAFHDSAVGRELGLALPLATKIALSLGGTITVVQDSAQELSIRLELARFTKERGARIVLP